MQTRRIVLVAAALGIAVATIRLAGGFGGGEEQVIVPQPAGAEPAPTPVVETTRTVRVLVAAADLPAGTLVQAEQLTWRPWPQDGLDGAYLVEGRRTPQEYVGAVVRTGIRAGEPVFEGRVVKPGERGFLAAVLNPEMRAVSVPINAVTGIAGFVFPGDRVDVILTQTVQRQDDPERTERRAAETVLTDVRVLAIDQRTNDQDAQKPVVSQIATLEVSPRQAEWLPLVVELGQLSLSLRSLERAPDGAKAEAAPAKPRRTYTWDSDVSTVLPDPGRIRKIQVIRGGKAEEVSFGRN